MTSNFEFVLGGTFDPVHNGHLGMIVAVQKLAPEINIRLIPCAIPALKSEPSSSFEHRVKMLELATKAINNIVIDTRESNRAGTSYSVETLTSLKNDFPNKCFIWIMGTDSLVELTHWFEWQKLHSLCHLLVLNRPKTPVNLAEIKLQQAGFKLTNNFLNFSSPSSGLGFMLKMAEKCESSTQIRQNLRNNLELDSMLPQSVIKYIAIHHLYANDGSS